LQDVPEAMLEQMMNATPAEKRLGTPADVAAVAAFLAEEGSKWVNGTTISVSGGMDMI
jgi:3-oxoacyl-[acyl-carrier protein] reductase